MTMSLKLDWVCVPRNELWSNTGGVHKKGSMAVSVRYPLHVHTSNQTIFWRRFGRIQNETAKCCGANRKDVLVLQLTCYTGPPDIHCSKITTISFTDERVNRSYDGHITSLSINQNASPHA